MTIPLSDRVPSLGNILPHGEDWVIRLIPRRILVSMSAVVFACVAFTAMTGSVFERHTDMERVMTPIFCACFFLILLASIRLPDQRLYLVTNALKVVGGIMLLAGTIDGLAFFDPEDAGAENHLVFYVCWLPVYHAAIFYISSRGNALRWSLLFLAIFTVTVVVLSYIGPLPMHHDNVVVLYFSVFPQLAGILIVHFISVFREDLATERTRIQVLQDMTAKLRKESEAAERARQQAAASDRAKSIFVANMSHELRTPLNAILGFSQMMEMGTFGPIDSRYRGYAGDIRTSAEDLLGQINNILEVSRVDLGSDTMREEVTGTVDLVSGCIRLVQQKADDRKIGIFLHADANLPAVRIDPERMRQVITNLLSNAVKFNRAGGRVDVTVKEGADGSVVIQVADTGIGMSESEVRQSLDLFHQSDNGFIRKYQGVGLGLSIARSLIELHGGGIDIESTPGKGTAVSVTLPATRVSRAASGSPDAERASHGAPVIFARSA